MIDKVKKFLTEKRCKNFLKNNRGFSLLEIMVAVTLMGIIAAVAIPSYTKYKTRANHGVVKNSLNSIGRGATACLTLGERTECNTIQKIGITCPTGITCPHQSIPHTGSHPLCFEVTSGNAKGCVSILTTGDSSFSTSSGIAGKNSCTEVTPTCPTANAAPQCLSTCTVKHEGSDGADTCDASKTRQRGSGGGSTPKADTCEGTYDIPITDLPKCDASNGTCG